MADSSVDLAGIFQSVTRALAENQMVLNQADDLNQNHGDNMVQTFQTITRALQQKKSSSDSAALAYAAKRVAQTASSGSSQLYAENLTRAAAQFKGQKIDAQGALQLLQMLIGGQPGQTPAQTGGGDLLGSLLGGMAGPEAGSLQQGGADQSAQTGDLLGSLLGGLMGGSETGGQPQAQPAAGGEDLLGALLGGLTGAGGTGQASQGGLNMNGLLAAGMAFLQARQSGGSNLQALVQAFMAYSGMGSSVHRNASTQVVVQSFLQALQAQQ